MAETSIEWTDKTYRFNALTSADDEHVYNVHPALDWLVIGGESGPGARPCNIQWIRDVRDQCRAAAVPLFVKQLGARPFVFQHQQACELNLRMNRKGGDMSEWPEDLRIREWPA